ncbi:MAG: spermidine/putrescine transport system substrate-binding protein [Oleiphilaceae bacterium]|jgi:spermidine/putrescine transport system substrate-binding protein
MDLDDRIDFVVPKEGTNIGVDYIAVLEASAQKPAAYAFISYINRPDIAPKLAEELYYASPNAAATTKLLSTDFLADSTIYPPAEVLDKSEVIKTLSSKAMSY